MPKTWILSQIGKDIESVRDEVNATFNKPKDFQNDKTAQDIAKFAQSKEFKQEVKKAEDYILDDKGFDFGKYAYSEQTMSMIRELEKNKHLVKNEYLEADERIFIIISSSMKDETIKNYFSDLQNVTSDITYVLRGVVGNDISKFKPTQDFIVKSMSKSGKITMSENESDEDFYNVSIEINPKITRRFKIEKVPAVLFIKNYNPAVQDFQNFIGTPDENEKYYIAYGEVQVGYALQEINKKAKSKGLDRLIKGMNKSFYNENGGLKWKTNSSAFTKGLTLGAIDF